ncbi:protein lin-37 homolog [Bacillus rossius redtenbacheri]|uniref:protein lin-37 homolog n=1 Tax=Bacillus rossius redtenbacheri TaxID=93214 RepID=UPI002FDE4F98
MVKKRKPGPITFPRVKVEVKSEDKSIPGIDDARDRLKGALQELLGQSSDSSLSSSDEEREESARPAPVKKERASAPSTPKTARSAKRRRRRDSAPGSAFHHTFVMKMFDRSVDLAQFEENSPLYAVCRGWMANQPHGAGQPTKQQAETPERSGDEAVKEEEEGSEEGEEYEDVWAMPGPSPLPSDPGELRRLRIPSPVPHEQAELDGKAAPGREALLGEHLKHWAQVSRKWRAAAQRNEQRYTASLQLLRTMYKRAQ